MKLREFNGQDADGVVALFRNAVLRIDRSFYTQVQLDAWARFADEPERFVGRLKLGKTLLADQDGYVVGFGQLHPQDHIEMLYCLPSHAGKGIGTMILAELERIGGSRGTPILTTESSAAAQPFFLRRGYRTIAAECVDCFGVELQRFRMQKSLASRLVRE